MAFAPTPHTIVHIIRYEDTSGDKDEHGNWPVSEDDPVIRKVYSITQFGRRGSSREVMGPEYQERTDTVLHIAVPNPTVYGSADQVLVNAELDVDGNYVPGTGQAYWVDGDPADERLSPWPRYTSAMGGVIKVRRVT